MRIVIDMQWLQVNDRLCSNTGRYTLKFAQVIAKHKDNHELILVMNGVYPESIEPIRAAFDDILPQENIHLCSVPDFIRNGYLQENSRHIEPAKLIQSAFIADLYPDLDVFDIRALFEENTEETFRAQLENGSTDIETELEWDDIACKLWKSFEELACSVSNAPLLPSDRPRLAVISPLPPEASGISDYTAELLPALAQHYRIEVVVVQDELTDEWVSGNCAILDVDWFRQHAHEFDRILYHFGNSHFHSHMFALLHEYPGVVVLHDFFLSGALAPNDLNGETPNSWAKELQQAHGWKAVAARFQTLDISEVIMDYPCNLQVLQYAIGVIVHSDYSKKLASDWYGTHSADDWDTIPLLRKPTGNLDKISARRKLGLAEDEFIVCSFGHLGPTKLNHRLLAAWQASPLSQDKTCRLVFVGQNHNGDYGVELEQTISDASDGSLIEITGWADISTYHQWLEAADLGVQLRTLSRGETSAAVLDCMNYGLATIINANGSMGELDQEALWMLPDEFSDSQLVEALTTLWTNKQQQSELSSKAKNLIAQHHAPEPCARLYAEAIEKRYAQADAGMRGLLNALTTHLPHFPESEWPSLACSIANNTAPHPRRRQLLVDVSALVETDLRTGIQRVVRSVLVDWLNNPPADWQIEPVYSRVGDQQGFRYARRFTSQFLGIADHWAIDEIVETHPGDLFLGLDFHWRNTVDHSPVLEEWHSRGVNIQFVIYDILPLLMPTMFPEHAAEGHRQWIETVAKFDGAVCISRAVASEMETLLQSMTPKRTRPFTLKWFHLGADADNSAPSSGMPVDAVETLSMLNDRPTFLSVGTVEPRKGHAQTLSAFESLWAQGIDANLVFVGKQGWAVETLTDQLRNHSELGKRLFWLEGISDEYLEEIYATSTCLIAASEGEGFGLPLIEAAQHRLPIIARDIPVFREVAGEHAYYFQNMNDSNVIAKAVDEWLKLQAIKQAPQSVHMPWLTWAQSAEQLLNVVSGTNRAGMSNR